MDRKTRFYIAHSFVNLIITILTFGDMVTTLRNPIESMSLPYSLVPTYLQMAFHLLHCIVDYNHMDIIDWLHHLLSSLTVGALNIIWTYGPLLNYGLFFATGFPGGIDYALLALVKLGYCDRMTEKKINRYLNMWIRMPGLLVWMGIGWTCYCDNRFEMPLVILLTQFLFIAGNSIYFADRVVLNLGMNFKE